VRTAQWAGGSPTFYFREVPALRAPRRVSGREQHGSRDPRQGHDDGPRDPGVRRDGTGSSGDEARARGLLLRLISTRMEASRWMTVPGSAASFRTAGRRGSDRGAVHPRVSSPVWTASPLGSRFARFAGRQIRLSTLVPLQGRRNSRDGWTGSWMIGPDDAGGRARVDIPATRCEGAAEIDSRNKFQGSRGEDVTNEQ